MYARVFNVSVTKSLLSTSSVVLAIGLQQTATASAELRCPTQVIIKEVATELVNKIRRNGKQCGKRFFDPVEEVNWSNAIQRATTEHSQSMANNNYFSHTGDDGSTAGERLYESAYNWVSYGENVAAGTRSVKQTIENWLMSPAHCENIMNPDFTEMALSCAVNNDSDYTLYWTQILAAPKSKFKSKPNSE